VVADCHESLQLRLLRLPTNDSLVPVGACRHPGLKPVFEDQTEFNSILPKLVPLSHATLSLGV
jgi:hypothetical protein